MSCCINNLRINKFLTNQWFRLLVSFTQFGFPRILQIARFSVHWKVPLFSVLYHLVSYVLPFSLVQSSCTKLRSLRASRYDSNIATNLGPQRISRNTKLLFREWSVGSNTKNSNLENNSNSECLWKPTLAWYGSHLVFYHSKMEWKHLVFARWLKIRERIIVPLDPHHPGSIPGHPQKSHAPTSLYGKNWFFSIGDNWCQ